MIPAMPDPDDLDHAADRDPAVALPAIGRIRAWLDKREAASVHAARREGWSWGRIGDALGRTRQALWQRYREE
jgi:hypothetical protein